VGQAPPFGAFLTRFTCRVSSCVLIGASGAGITWVAGRSWHPDTLPRLTNWVVSCADCAQNFSELVFVLDLRV
jgi:hypothetical protein